MSIYVCVCVFRVCNRWSLMWFDGRLWLTKALRERRGTALVCKLSEKVKRKTFIVFLFSKVNKNAFRSRSERLFASNFGQSTVVDTVIDVLVRYSSNGSGTRTLEVFVTDVVTLNISAINKRLIILERGKFSKRIIINYYISKYISCLPCVVFERYALYVWVLFRMNKIKREKSSWKNRTQIQQIRLYSLLFIFKPTIMVTYQYRVILIFHTA